MNSLIVTLSLFLTIPTLGMASDIFFDDFSGPTLNPLWAGPLPDAPGASGDTTPEAYAGFPNYQLQTVGADSLLRMSNSLSDLQRVGWSLNTNFPTSDFRYEVRFNTLIQSYTNSIDAFIEIWVLDAANSNRYDIVSLFGGSYGSDRRFRAGSSISGTRYDQSFAYLNNTFYRLVLQGSSTQNIRASFLDDQGNELAGVDLGHNTSSFTSGFKIAISQGEDRPQGTYPIDVAVDYALLTLPPAVIITSQPTNQTIVSGNNATFSVKAQGAADLYYQWWFGGTNIIGATNSMLTLTNVQLSDGGSYFVVVTNLYGSTISSNAVLTVTNQAPYITTQPKNTNVVVGAGTTFTVIVGGSKPLSYQWQFNGNSIDNATNSSYAITSVQTTNAGAYSVVVVNPVSSIASSNATLTVTVLPIFISDDFEPSIDQSQWSAFGATVLATNYGGYVSPSNSLWFGGSGLRYATTHLLNTTAGGPITFYMRFAVGTSNKWETLDLPSKGVVLEYSINQGTTWPLIATYATTNYTNWTFISTNMPVGAKSPATLFRWRQLANSGSNFDHWALDDVNVGPQPPKISTQPTNQIAFTGQNATFTVTVTGTAPFSYQWQSNTVNIIGATNASLILTNVQLSQSGAAYSVTVTNISGSAAGSNALLTVTLPPAAIQAVNTNGMGGTSIEVPIIFTANGNENALSFSVNFDANRLAYSDILLGSSVPEDASFLPSTGQAGTVGVSLLLPAGHAFAAGTQEIVRLIFNAPILTGTQTVATAISFANVPINKLLSDINVQALPANFINGTVTLYPGPLEGDAIGRPLGDGFVDIFDWQQVGRFVAGLDVITNASEFQRVDCAPRTNLGDGQIKVTDWVQAGRYAAGLDPLALAGGPTSSAQSLTAHAAGSSGGVQPKNAGSRQVSIAAGTVVKGLTMTLPVSLEAQGNESALAFSLSFDPVVLRYVSASKGSAATSATLNVNTNQIASGQLAIALMLPAGSSHFAAGTKEVAKVTFIALSTATNESLDFSDQPALRSISDTNAIEVTATYANSLITINSNPLLSISNSGTNILLAWPTWAADFTLQNVDTIVPSATWSNPAITLQTNGGSINVTLPASTQSKYFRLFHP